jgi:hypothetical protein
MSIFNPAERTEEQRLYCEMVDRHASERIDSAISNGKAEHAIYLISKLFGMAGSHVRLYSDRLKHKLTELDRDDNGAELDFYGHTEVIKKAIPLLFKDGAKLDIVVENDIDDLKNHQLVNVIKMLQEQGSLKAEVSFRKMTKEGLNLLGSIQFPNHFMVSDNKAYRVELNDIPLNYQAEANFNNAKIAEKISGIFDLVHLRHSDPIEVF